MELSRLRRMIRAKWWLVALAIVLGLAGALAWVNYNNANIESRFTATGNIEFSLGVVATEDTSSTLSTSGRTSTGSSSSASPASSLVTDSEPIAADANAAILEEGAGQMRAVPNAGVIEFVASGTSAEAAEAIIEQMYANYDAVDPLKIDIPASIEALVADAAEIREKLAAFEPPPDPEVPAIPIEIQAEIDTLNSRIGVTSSLVGPLQTEINTELEESEPDLEFIAEKVAEIGVIEARIVELRRAVDALTPVAPEPEPFVLTPGEELEKAALDAQLQEIGLQYSTAVAAQDGPQNTSTFLEIVAEDVTPSPASPTLFGIVGLIAGLMLGVVAIVFIDRVQDAVWTPSDMAKMPVIAEIPSGSGALGRKRSQIARQGGVQSVRSAILGLLNAEGASTVGFTGLGASDTDVTELVFDVANSLAGVGRSVLLIDGNMGGLAAWRDRVSGGSTLADLVTHDADDTTLGQQVGTVLANTVQLSPNLHVLPGDPRTSDAVDTLASKSFRELTAQATQRYDVVVVVGPSALSPFAYVMTGLVSAYVVVSSPGSTRQAHIDQLATQFAAGGNRLIGSVLVGSTSRGGFAPTPVPTAAAVQTADQPGSRAATVEDPDAGLLDRLGQSIASLAGDNTNDQ